MNRKTLPIFFLLTFAGLDFLFGQGAIQSPLRLVDIVEHPGVVVEDRFFGMGVDWDDTEILATTSKSLHVYDSETRAYKYRLGPVEPIDEGYGNNNVLVTPSHFLIRASRVNRRDKLYVYNRSTRLLERTITPPLGSNSTPGFGTAMVVQGNSLFISIMHHSAGDDLPYVGAVYRYDMETWEHSPLVFRSGEGEWFDGFGQDIAIEGNFLLVGSPRKSNFEGTAYLFKIDTGEFIKKFQMPTPAHDEWFGTSVLLRNGQAYISSRSGIWQFDTGTLDLVEEYFPDPLPGTYDSFGSDMEIINDELLVAWSKQGIYQFDLNFDDLIRFLPNPLDTGTSSTGPGRMKTNGRFLLTRATGGTAPGTEDGALIVFNVQPNQSVVEVSAGEEFEGQSSVIATVAIIPPAQNDVLIHYETRQDSAREGLDFEAQSGTLTIPAGEPEGQIILSVLDDDHSEPRERFFLDILGGTGASITPVEIEIGILDTDSVPISSVYQTPVPLPSFPDDELGYELAAINNTAYVSTLDIDSSGAERGGVRVIDLHTKKLLSTLHPPGLPLGANFGTGLAVSENILAVGSRRSHDQADTPAIYLYNRDDLTIRTVLRPPDDNHNSFGDHIAIGEEYILVGLPFEDRLGFQVGDVLVYDVQTNEYLYRIENPLSPIPGSELGREFGQALAFSGSRAVIGAFGRVHVFDLERDKATFSHELEHSTRDTAHMTSDFGEEVVANEDYIVVGNRWDDSFYDNSGSIIVYDARSGAHLNTIRSRFSIGSANFGQGLSLYGNIIAVVGQKNWGVHLMEIPTGHEIVKHLTAGGISNGFRQRVVLTDQYIVVGAPWGKNTKQGTLVAFPRDGRNFDVWERGALVGRETLDSWESTLDEGELFFRYATGWEQNDQPLGIKPGQSKRGLLEVITRGTLRRDARYWIQSSTTGTEWHNLIEVDPELEEPPETTQWKGDKVIYSLEDPRIDSMRESSLYRLNISPR